MVLHANQLHQITTFTEKQKTLQSLDIRWH